MTVHQWLTSPPARACRSALSVDGKPCGHQMRADCLTPTGVVTWITASVWPNAMRSWRGNAYPLKSGKCISGEDYLPFSTISNAALCEIINEIWGGSFNRFTSGGFISSGTTQQCPENWVPTCQERIFGTIDTGFLAYHKGRPEGNSHLLSWRSALPAR